MNNLTMLGNYSDSVKSVDFGRVVNLRACCSLNDDEKWLYSYLEPYLFQDHS